MKAFSMDSLYTARSQVFINISSSAHLKKKPLQTFGNYVDITPLNLPVPGGSPSFRLFTPLQIDIVPEGISSSLRDFIVLVFNIEVFQIKFS